jgi:nicotinamide mononucleotide (NMN) deamidase PncC
MRKEQKPDNILLDLISDILTEDHETVAIAESVTAGQLQTVFSLAENSMQFFQGGITTYNLEQKVKHLHVDPSHASKVKLRVRRSICTNGKECGRAFSK